MLETTLKQIEKLEIELLELKKKRSELKLSLPLQETSDYSFTDRKGSKVSLSDLFGDKDELILIHNMGSSCSYCTRWADGFIGILPWLEERAAFALVSPDDHIKQAAFADERGWKFKMVSTAGNSFSADMGYESSDGSQLPGVSTFSKNADGKIERIAHAPFGPGDDFCSIWHFFDLLPTK